MIIKNSTISKGFIAAGLINIGGVLIFSKFFTNSVISEFDPTVLSNFGLLMIVVWGFAYLSLSKDYSKVKWLVGVFAVEKFIYGFLWTKWMLNNDLSAVYTEDTMAGVFYTIYGINDWMFFIFFFYVFSRLILKNK
jgi:hypothetical protein